MDVSFWQDNNNTPEQIDFVKAQANGMRFVYVRAGQGTGGVDPDLMYNWEESKRAGLLRGAYHFLDYSRPIIPQVAGFLNLFRDDPPELPFALDFEYLKRYGSFPSHYKALDWLHPGVEYIQKQGYRPMIYTNWGTIKYTLSPVPTWLLDIPLWVAHWLKKKPPFSMFRDNNPINREPNYNPWWDWTFWQYTDKGDGIANGMESKQLDMNYFNGSLEELITFSDPTVSTPTPTTPASTDSEVQLVGTIISINSDIDIFYKEILR